MGRHSTPRILIVGGGHVGMNVALRLQRRLLRGEAEVVLVDPHSHQTYQPLLAEAAAGNVEPRHVAVPLRRLLPRVRIITAELVSLSHAGRRAVVRLASDEHRELGYEHLVLAPGSVGRTLPIPGLAEVGVGFKSIGEAVYLRNRVLERMAFATSTMDDHARRRALTFLVVTALPRDDEGRLVADAFLRVRDSAGAWTAGDCAAVPDLTAREPGTLCAATAQHAVRQARRLADNLIAELRGRPVQAYRHRYVGSVASLGRFQGAAQLYGARVRGLPAWLMHRAYHWTKLPTAGRKARGLAGRMIGAVFPRDVVS